MISFGKDKLFCFYCAKNYFDCSKSSRKLKQTEILCNKLKEVI